MFDRRSALSRPSPAFAADEVGPPPAAGSRGGGGAPAPVLAVVWRRRWVVAACVALSLGGAVAYLAKAVPIYASSSQIYIDQNRPKIIGEGLNAGGNGQSYLFTQCELIRSTAILSAALEKPEAAQVEALRGSDNPVGVLKASLDVGVSKQGDIVSVSAESPRPADAALMVNAVVDAYIEHTNRQVRSTAAEVLKVLKKEKDGYLEQLKSLSADMLKFQRDNGAIGLDAGKGNIANLQLAELSDAVTKAQLETLNAKVTLESAEALGKEPARLRQFLQTQRERAAGTSGSPAAGGVGGADPRWSELRLLELKIERYRTDFGENHPMLSQLRGQAADLRASLDADGVPAPTGPGATAAAAAAAAGGDKKFVENWLAVLRETLNQAGRRERALDDRYQQQLKAALDLNAKAAEFQQMEATVRRTEKILDTLDSRMKEVGVTGNADAITTVTVLEVAKPVAAPVRPARPKTLGLAVVVGLMLGLGAALGLDWLDQRIRSADEISGLLGLSVLGVVPHIAGKRTGSQRGQEIHLQPRSDVAEAYRTIRTAIYFGAPEVKSKVILVTSPSPGDGKTTMASNLALAIAQANRRALLVDADCRRPTQHRVFGIEAGVGLSTVLAGGATADEAIRTGVAGGLDVMPCGPLPSNPAEALGGRAFADLLAELSLRYDQIVVDSPPVVPVTDARILAAAADVTVLVLRAEKSTRRLAEHARDALATVGANVLGVVVNDVPRHRGGYGYNYYGAYGYGYGNAQQQAALEGEGHASGGSGTNGHRLNGKRSKPVRALVTPPSDD